MKIVNKEYFAYKCAQEVNGCKYIYKEHITGIIDGVKHKFQIAVENMTDSELEEYITEIIKELFAY